MCERRLLIALCVAVAAWIGPLTCRTDAQTAYDIRLIKKLGEADAKDRQFLTDLQDPVKRNEKMEEMLTGYDREMRKAAKDLFEGKKAPAQLVQIATLRDKALAVIAREKLTKEQILKDLDPLFEELEQLLTPTRGEALADRKGLQQLRRKFSRIQNNGNAIKELEKTWLVRLLCENTEQLEILVKNTELAKSLDADERAGILETNRRRLILGLEPLAIDLRLVTAGRDHCKDMIAQDFFAHTSPVEGKTTPWDRARLAGTRANGENIAAGQATGLGAVMAWWYSPGHLKNMMNPSFDRIGLGRQASHWTQMFGKGDVQ